MSLHTVIAQFTLVQHTTPALVHNVCYPDSADTKTVLLASLEQLIPQRLVQFFWKAISMCSDDSNVTGLGALVAEWRVLLNGQI